MTPQDIKKRLEQAGRTLMLLPMPRRGLPAEHGSNWPEVVRTARDYWVAALTGEDEDPEEAKWRMKELEEQANRTRVQVSRRDIEQMDESLEWLWFVEDEKKRRVVLSRSLIHPISDRHVASYAKLGRRFHRNERTIRTWFDDGINEIACGLLKKNPLAFPEIVVFNTSTSE